MDILLDTHVILWAASMPEKLSPKITEFILDKKNNLFFSVASIWEIVIKNNLGRKEFSVDVHKLRKGLLINQYQELNIQADHVTAVSQLPNLHKDPFDRLLIAQAQVEAFELITVDQAILQYTNLN